MDGDGGGWMWLLMTVVGVLLLALLMVFGIYQRRHRNRARDAVTEAVTKQRYDEAKGVESETGRRSGD